MLNATFERSDGAPPSTDLGGIGNGRGDGLGTPSYLSETERGASAPVPLCATVLPLAEVDRLADEIAELAAHLDAGTHRLLTLIRRLDEGSGWYTQGAMSCAQWLSWRIGLDLCAAREKVRVARALGSLPHIDEALRRGRVSYSKVRALTRVATPENEGSLLEMARCSTASQLERICRGYRRALNGLLGTHPVDEAHRRWIRDSSTQDGMIRIEIQVTPEEAAVVKKAIELAMDRAWKELPEEQGDSAEAPAGEERNSAEACQAGERTSAETSATIEVATPRERPSGPRGWWPRSIRRVDAFMNLAEGYLRSASDDGRPPVEIVVTEDQRFLRLAPSWSAFAGIQRAPPIADAVPRTCPSFYPRREGATARRATRASTRSLRARREGKYCSRMGGNPCQTSTVGSVGCASGAAAAGAPTPGGSSVSMATTSAASRTSSAETTRGR